RSDSRAEPGALSAPSAVGNDPTASVSQSRGSEVRYFVSPAWHHALPLRLGLGVGSATTPTGLRSSRRARLLHRPDHLTVFLDCGHAETEVDDPAPGRAPAAGRRSAAR